MHVRSVFSFHLIADLSAEPVGGTAAETAAFMRTEVERWNKVIKAANVKLQ